MWEHQKVISVTKRFCIQAKKHCECKSQPRQLTLCAIFTFKGIVFVFRIYLFHFKCPFRCLFFGICEPILIY